MFFKLIVKKIDYFIWYLVGLVIVFFVNLIYEVNIVGFEIVKFVKIFLFNCILVSDKLWINLEYLNLFWIVFVLIFEIYNFLKFFLFCFLFL